MEFSCQHEELDKLNRKVATQAFFSPVSRQESVASPPVAFDGRRASYGYSSFLVVEALKTLEPNHINLQTELRTAPVSSGAVALPKVEYLFQPPPPTDRLRMNHEMIGSQNEPRN